MIHDAESKQAALAWLREDPEGYFAATTRPWPGDKAQATPGGPDPHSVISEAVSGNQDDPEWIADTVLTALAEAGYLVVRR